MSSNSSGHGGSSSSDRGGPNIRDEMHLMCKSPEQLDPGMGGTDDKADMWALGVIAYFLLSGQSPFQWAAYKEEIIKKAMYTFMPPELWRPVSSEAKNFIALCLQREASTRPGASQALQLPWMQLALQAIEEEQELLKSGRLPLNFNKLTDSTDGNVIRISRLGIRDPPLETSDRILSSFLRMNQLNKLEKACVITAAHRIPACNLVQLANTLVNMDKPGRGMLSAEQLFEALKDYGVTIDELMTLMTLGKGMDQESNGCTIDYPQFIRVLDEFQKNMQDSAVWSVFRSFDSTNVTRKELASMLKKEDYFDTVAEKFPDVALDHLLEDFSTDGDVDISPEEFKRILRNYKKGGGVPASSWETPRYLQNQFPSGQNQFPKGINPPGKPVSFMSTSDSNVVRQQSL